MKKILKISSVVALILAMMLTLVSCKGASPDNASGTCGTGLTWSYDSETKVLSISGNGTMTDFEASADQPWAAVKSAVKTVTVSDGVQNIGDRAFYSFPSLESVNLPESVTSVGKASFAFCTVAKTISLPSSLQTIGAGAFEGCSSLGAAFVPASVTSIGERAFAYCSSVTDAAILTAVNIPDSAFANCRSLDKLLLNTGISEDMIAKNAFNGCSVGYADASFTESSTASASVTIKYLDSDGNELHEPIVKADLDYGDSYSVVSPAVEGYTADKLTVSGYVYGEDVTVTVTYTADVADETEPVDETEKEKEPIGASTIIPIVIFAVLLIGIAVAAVLIVRSEKKNAAKGQTVRKNDPKNSKRK